jgi:hypothetical protein
MAPVWERREVLRKKRSNRNRELLSPAHWED